MPTLTKKVFLSSTLVDLKDYRAAAIHVCQRAGLLPIYMEDFLPDPRDAVALCMERSTRRTSSYSRSATGE